MTTFWHDDQFRYDGQRPTWDTSELDPTHDRYYPMRGYVEQVQQRIDDPDFDNHDTKGGDLPCRG